jgi:hypothetical protein
MTELSNALSMIGDPLLIFGLLALAVGLLEAERLWTRGRRRRGRRVGSLAYIMDALAIVSAALATASALALLARGVMSAVVLGGALLDWALAQARAHSGLLATIAIGTALAVAGAALRAIGCAGPARRGRSPTTDRASTRRAQPALRKSAPQVRLRHGRRCHRRSSSWPFPFPRWRRRSSWHNNRPMLPHIQPQHHGR